MPRTILILTQLGDVHAYAVAEALRRKGAKALLWHMGDFPTCSVESLSLSGRQKEINLRGPDLHLSNHSLNAVDVVWRRRPGFVIDPRRLHPADRKFAETECLFFRKALLDVLAPKAFWVNSPESALRADSKIFQHVTAVAVGFQAPASLYGNDPEEIRNFIRAHGGQVVYKPFRGLSWRNESTAWVPYTTLVTEAQLVEDDLLQLTPGIFQEVVPKAYELRVTAIGKRTFAAKIHSQETKKGRLDWRRSYDELTFESAVLPGRIHDHCLEVMARLGIVFGCFDIIVTPEGEHIFLEVNEMGQFLFVEHYTGMPLLDAFCEFLISGASDFRWAEEDVTVHYSDLEARVAEISKGAAVKHVPASESHVWEGDTPEDSGF